ncbi:hypothetical protein HanIR_Chr10g0475941 [Helianthus annuus]|nr:hypothetical protein HanIR_Chr10g0475941 [Helianthus annuus]
MNQKFDSESILPLLKIEVYQSTKGDMPKISNNKLTEFQGLSFIFIPIFRRCPLCLKLTSFVLYVFISYTFCPLGLTQLVFLVKFGHVL